MEDNRPISCDLMEMDLLGSDRGYSDTVSDGGYTLNDSDLERLIQEAVLDVKSDGISDCTFGASSAANSNQGDQNSNQGDQVSDQGDQSSNQGDHPNQDDSLVQDDPLLEEGGPFPQNVAFGKGLEVQMDTTRYTRDFASSDTFESAGKSNLDNFGADGNFSDNFRPMDDDSDNASEDSLYGAKNDFMWRNPIPVNQPNRDFSPRVQDDHFNGQKQDRGGLQDHFSHQDYDRQNFDPSSPVDELMHSRKRLSLQDLDEDSKIPLGCDDDDLPLGQPTKNHSKVCQQPAANDEIVSTCIPESRSQSAECTPLDAIIPANTSRIQEDTNKENSRALPNHEISDVASVGTVFSNPRFGDSFLEIAEDGVCASGPCTPELESAPNGGARNPVNAELRLSLSESKLKIHDAREELKYKNPPNDGQVSGKYPVCAEKDTKPEKRECGRQDEAKQNMVVGEPGRCVQVEDLARAGLQEGLFSKSYNVEDYRKQSPSGLNHTAPPQTSMTSMSPDRSRSKSRERIPGNGVTIGGALSFAGTRRVRSVERQRWALSHGPVEPALAGSELVRKRKRSSSCVSRERRATSLTRKNSSSRQHNNSRRNGSSRPNGDPTQDSRDSRRNSRSRQASSTRRHNSSSRIETPNSATRSNRPTRIRPISTATTPHLSNIGTTSSGQAFVLPSGTSINLGENHLSMPDMLSSSQTSSQNNSLTLRSNLGDLTCTEKSYDKSYYKPQEENVFDSFCASDVRPTVTIRRCSPRRKHGGPFAVRSRSSHPSVKSLTSSVSSLRSPVSSVSGTSSKSSDGGSSSQSSRTSKSTLSPMNSSRSVASSRYSEASSLADGTSEASTSTVLTTTTYTSTEASEFSQRSRELSRIGGPNFTASSGGSRYSPERGSYCRGASESSARTSREDRRRSSKSSNDFVEMGYGSLVWKFVRMALISGYRLTAITIDAINKRVEERSKESPEGSHKLSSDSNPELGPRSSQECNRYQGIIVHNSERHKELQKAQDQVRPRISSNPKAFKKRVKFDDENWPPFTCCPSQEVIDTWIEVLSGK